MSTTESDIIKIHLTREQMVTVWRDANAASIGGVSHVRDREDRVSALKIDQIAGLAGNMALCVWRDGDDRTYKEMRYYQNRYPNLGDAGCDLPRCLFDIKTSIMRASPDPMSYRLAVRPAERHRGHTYGLALIREFDTASLSNGLDVLLVGWKRECNLPECVEASGVFSGAFVVPSKELIPFTPLVYER